MHLETKLMFQEPIFYFHDCGMKGPGSREKDC